MMDTRNKIIPVDRAASIASQLRDRGAAIRVVTGYFDVLVPDHVRRLSEIADATGTLFALVLDPPQPLLSRRARAELVAALGVIDYVVPVEEQAAKELLSHFHPGEIVREESADLLRASRLSLHVQGRHQQ
jgi:bifunctional ADP-heptose synthase (sugar kinase/adenylyltransferase)